MVERGVGGNRRINTALLDGIIEFLENKTE